MSKKSKNRKKINEPTFFNLNSSETHIPFLSTEYFNNSSFINLESNKSPETNISFYDIEDTNGFSFINIQDSQTEEDAISFHNTENEGSFSINVDTLGNKKPDTSNSTYQIFSTVDHYSKEALSSLFDSLPDSTPSTNLSEQSPLSPKNNVSKTVSSKSSSSKPSYEDLARSLVENHYIIQASDSLTYIYSPNDGYYIPLLKNNSQYIIRSLIPIKYRKYLSSFCITEILYWLPVINDRIIADPTYFFTHEYINFQNCFLHINSGKTYKQSPEIFFTHSINAEYFSRDLTCTYFLDFITQITDGDSSRIDLLQEVMGYILSEYRCIKSFIYLLGPSNSGKSTFLELLENLIGKPFCSNIGLHELSDKFSRVHLFGKRLNTFGEISEFTLNRLDYIKLLTGNDSIKAEFKGQDGFEFVNKAVLVFAGNCMPKIKIPDSGNALSNRMVLISFPNSIPPTKQVHNLMSKLLDESSFIVQWAIKGLDRLIHNNFIFTTCDEDIQIKNTYFNKSDSIKSFISDKCIFNSSSRIYTEDLYNYYLDYCYTNDFKAETRQAFTLYINNKYATKLSYTRYREASRNQYGFIGIGLLN